MSNFTETRSPMRSLRIAVAAATVAAAMCGIPAHASGAQRVYLNQVSTCDSPRFVVSTRSADTNECAYIPRFLYKGTGLQNRGDETFRNMSLPRIRIGKAGVISGAFAIMAVGPVHGAALPADLVGMVEATFTVTIDNRFVGSVDVSGTSTPGSPATRSFRFALPRALRGATLRAISVGVVWQSCVAAIGCGVVVHGPAHGGFSIPKG